MNELAIEVFFVVEFDQNVACRIGRRAAPSQHVGQRWARKRRQFQSRLFVIDEPVCRQ